MLLLMALIIYLNGCGGGGGSSAATPTAQAPNNPQNATDLATAQKAYDGVPRTPAGFYAETAPTVTGTVATVHLKNTDLPGAPMGSAAFELCSDNLSDATAWSEGKSQFMGSYADLVDVGSETRFWELTRVPRADVNSRLRHRIFKCGYVDRGNSDPAADSGPAGILNSRPVDAAQMKTLSEYLWHYTTYNNADHVVLQSQAGNAPSDTLSHEISMARLTRAPNAGECDRIDVLRWTHSVNTTTGAVARQLQTLQTIRARRANGAVELCPP